MKNVKNSVFTSLVALTLCVAMLLGTTFAWFTDMAASNNNVVTAGTLDVQMHWSDELLDADSTEWKNVEDAATNTVFDYDLWEPGYTEIKYVKVYNNGNLNLKWRLTIEANGAVTELAEVIDVYYVNPVANEIDTLNGLESAGSIKDVMAEKICSSGSLSAEQGVILAVAFHMDEQAGNKYQGKPLCEDGFTLKLVAAQEIGEMGAFGDDYDEGAEWEEINFSASASLNNVDLVYGALASTLTIGTGDVNAELPADVKIADDASSLDLSVTNVNGTNITLGEGEQARSLNVHISGIAANNEQPMIVNLGKVMNPGIADTELKLYHTEGGVPVLMTRVASAADFALHNQYTYNEATGEVSIYVKSFSVFSLVQTEVSAWDGVSVATGFESGTGTVDDPYVIATAAQLIYFRDQVDGGNNFDGKTVKLGIDIDLNGKLFNPIGYGYAYKGGKTFNGTFDGQGHTVYNIYQNGWELEEATKDTNQNEYNGSSNGAGLFASLHNATIQNLAISGVEIVMETNVTGIVAGSAQGVCTFSDIVVSNANLGNYQMRNGGIVGDVYFTAEENTANEDLQYSHVFRNIIVDSTVKLSSLWGDFDNANGGVIGAKYGYSRVLMENVIVACEIDAFSDVTAAYQWYAYRRCGMLVGYIGVDSPKNGVRLDDEDIDFLTCVNVDVYYGSWVNYNYYEFPNQDSSTGKRYPWVRAEAGEYNSAFSNPRYGVPTYDGAKVSEMTKDNFANVDENYDYAAITFNQLYGGGQGVYGAAAHTNPDGTSGVQIRYAGTDYKDVTASLTIDTNDSTLNFEEIRIVYWFTSGSSNSEWTTVNDSGILIDEQLANGIYMIKIPVYASQFKIIAKTTDGKWYESEKVAVSAYADGTITLGGTHSHVDSDDNDYCDSCGELMDAVLPWLPMLEI